MWDVVIIGGGPAGLSAALILGRAKRKVLVCDDHHPRNAASNAIHGYLTQDGITLPVFTNAARSQLKPYPVDFREFRADLVKNKNATFEIQLSNKETVQSKKILLATGVQDVLPDLKGIEIFFGKSVFLCPYCDGWENKDKAIAVYGKGRRGPSLAITMRQWNADITLCTNGEEVDPRFLPCLYKHSVRIRKEPILKLEGSGTSLERIIFKSNQPLEVGALFFNSERRPQCDLGEKLGCGKEKNGAP